MATEIVLRPIIEGGVTELVGKDEQLTATQYAASVGVTLPSVMSGEILSVALYAYEAGTGAVLATAGTLYVFDADPAIAANDAALAAAGAEHKTILGMEAFATTDWGSDANGAAAFKAVSIPFHELNTLYFTFQPDTGETQINSLAGDDEHLDFNFWVRQDSQ